MKFSKLLLAGVASVALVSCGKKEKDVDAPASKTSQQAEKLNAGSPLDESFRLKNAEPVDMDAFFAFMPEDSRPTYESATFDNSLGATIVSNLRFADAPDGEAVIIERAEFFGLDLDAMGRVKGAENVTADAPFEKIFDKVRLYNVKAEGFEADEDAADFSIGGIEFDQLQIRQGGPEGDGVGEEGARFFNAVNLAGLYFKDIEVKTTDGDAPNVTLSAPDIRVVGFGGGKLGAIIATDFQYAMKQTEASRRAMQEVMGPQGAMFMSGPLASVFAPDSQRVKMDSFEWRNIDFSGLLSWALRNEEPPMSEENLIDLGQMKGLNMETFVGDKLAGSAKEFSMSSAEFKWLIPSKIRFDAKGGKYDYTAYVPDTEQEVLGIMKKHGLDDLKSDGYAEWIWNDKTGVATLDYVGEAPGFIDFSLKLGLDQLKLSEMQAAKEAGDDNPFAAIGAFSNFSFILKDEKALDAIFDIAALQMGGTGEDLRLSTPAMIRLGGAQAAQMNPRISDYIDAVADFIAKGGTLEVSANPAQPVGFAELQATGMTSPQTMPDVLNLQVTHKE